jgi:hypothetical protein
MPLSPAERKRQQRERDRAAGLVELTVKVPRELAMIVRDFVRALCASK